jgi:hypothetical protein
MANKLNSKRMSGKAVNEKEHSELLKVLNEMTMNKQYKQLPSNSTIDTVLTTLEYYDEVRVRKGSDYIRICKPVNGKYVWFINGRQYGFSAEDVEQGFTYDSRYLKEGINSPISVNYTGQQRWCEVLKDLLK